MQVRGEGEGEGERERGEKRAGTELQSSKFQKNSNC